jgi:metal-responsive CopG/Arc/MetJ family transcriptional regulator
MFLVEPMPTELKRLSVTFETELYQALERLSTRNKRSLSNQVSVILEQALLASGDLKAPIYRQESRGGKRENAGRKSKTEENDD